MQNRTSITSYNKSPDVATGKIENKNGREGRGSGCLSFPGSVWKRIPGSAGFPVRGKVMGEYFVKRPLKRSPVHPGEILREDMLPTLGLSASEVARRLGISRQQLHRVLACTHPISLALSCFVLTYSAK